MLQIMTSLNNRGYGISKTLENKDLIDKIKKELLISPKIFSNSFTSNVNKEYPIYLESDNKLYIPRYFGEKIYGKISIQILEGENTNLIFGKQSYETFDVHIFLKIVDCTKIHCVNCI